MAQPGLTLDCKAARSRAAGGTEADPPGLALLTLGLPVLGVCILQVMIGSRFESILWHAPRLTRRLLLETAKTRPLNRLFKIGQGSSYRAVYGPQLAWW
jgi:hypothetical protein